MRGFTHKAQPSRYRETLGSPAAHKGQGQVGARKTTDPAVASLHSGDLEAPGQAGTLRCRWDGTQDTPSPAAEASTRPWGQAGHPHQARSPWTSTH